MSREVTQRPKKKSNPFKKVALDSTGGDQAEGSRQVIFGIKPSGSHGVIELGPELGYTLQVKRKVNTEVGGSNSKVTGRAQ